MFRIGSAEPKTRPLGRYQLAEITSAARHPERRAEARMLSTFSMTTNMGGETPKIKGIGRFRHSSFIESAIDALQSWKFIPSSCLQSDDLSISHGSLSARRDTSRPRLEASVAICLWLIQNLHDLDSDRTPIRTGITDGLPSRKSNESCAGRSEDRNRVAKELSVARIRKRDDLRRFPAHFAIFNPRSYCDDISRNAAFVDNCRSRQLPQQILHGPPT
jgi:hypothetical protein